MHAMPVPYQCRLLHAGGAAGAWGNLGLWQPGRDYAGACAALAGRVGEAAGLADGARLLALACGAGDELLAGQRRHALASVVGIERDARLVALARQRLRGQPDSGRVTLVAGALPAALPVVDEGAFDAVTCVDAIYHLPARARLAAQVLSLLRPGGRFAFTDLVLPAPAPTPGVRAAARLCGVPPGELLDAASREAQLRAAGFVDVRSERLDAAVLGGFAAFVRRQERVIGAARWHPAWWGVAVTARLVGPCRAAGVGYALFSARRP